MAIAFIQMVVEPGKENDVKKRMEDLNFMSCEVEEAYMTYGEFDIVIKIVADAIEDINHFVLKIREIEGIKRTETSLVIGSM